MIDVLALGREQLARAKESPHGHSSHTFLRVGSLRQAIIALTGGAALGEHEGPPEVSLHLLWGRVRLVIVGGEETIELTAGHISPVPPHRHSLEADEDSVILLTTVA
ncbi:cupin [Streptosporangium sp. NPDC000396]|uniref:cupin n=1 Tax=Streptosporangium sp. NPDC000396 TaxID=3366185 RepID=UPI003690845E